MARPQSRYVCQSCARTLPRWEGRCPGCGGWDTLVETLVRDQPASRARASARDPQRPVPLRDLSSPQLVRHAVGIGELDRVLGGGLVPGSLVLLGGEPGIGKSTLVLQAAAGLAERTGRGAAADSSAAGSRGVVYASGEESAGQLRLRASRLGLIEGDAGEHVSILAETEVDRIIEAALAARPSTLIVDSIQTVSLDALEGPAGSVGQVRESANRLLGYAKGEGVPVVLVGHVTKDGSLAGPKTLEHIVDAVLTLEGERLGGLRLLRATKNRFGSTDEIGLFEMAGAGLREVRDPSRAFLSGAFEGAPGVAVGVTLGGTRPLVVEVQALVAPSPLTSPRRSVTGLDGSRLALLLAVLGRRAGIGLGGHDVYASLPGGLAAADPALDLPLALALASSYRDRPIRAGLVACGEVGLLGELRPVQAVERRLREARRLGFRDVLVPLTTPGETPLPDSDDLPRRIVVRTLREALDAALSPVAVRAGADA